MSNKPKKTDHNRIEADQFELATEKWKKVFSSSKKGIKKQKDKIPSTRSIPFSGKYV